MLSLGLHGLQDMHKVTALKWCSVRASFQAVTYVCILKTCATIGGAKKGKKIHDEIARQGLL